MSLLLFMVGLVDSSELADRHRRSVERTELVDRLARDSLFLASGLREVLHREGGADAPVVAATGKLIRDIAAARATLDFLATTIARRHGIEAGQRQALNEPVRRLRAILWLNTDPDPAIVPQPIHELEPVMPFTLMPNLGDVRSGLAPEDLRIDELCLLAFYASARPAHVLATVGAGDGWRRELEDGRYQDLQHRLEAAAEKATAGAWQQIRRHAVNLIGRWYATVDSADQVEAALLASATPKTLQEVLVARFRDLEALEDRLAGRVAINLPGVDQPVPMATALRFGPLLIAVWLVGSTLYLWSASAWFTRDPQALDGGGVDTPVPFIWYPHPAISGAGMVSLGLCLLLAFLPPLEMLATGLWSPVLARPAAAEAATEAAYWAGMVVLMAASLLWLASVLAINSRLARSGGSGRRRWSRWKPSPLRPPARR